MKKNEVMHIQSNLISRSHMVKRGSIILYDAKPQVTVLAKVEKIGQVAVNLTVKFDSKISGPNKHRLYWVRGKICLLQHSESFSQAYKGLM